tara:strand:+ start:114 stop:341 length:228 start_codon:yes stop_codon:yes gene_type:complete
VFWLILKIREWFKPKPIINARLSEKLKEHQKKKKLADCVLISDNSHTPTPMDANDETTRHPSHEHESKENSEKAE